MPIIKKGNLIFLQTNSRTYYYDESGIPLGKGAMGTVFKGYELERNVPVAIKRIRDEYANIPEIRHRALVEANLMFSHPNLVEMLGCCEYASGHGPIFIISEFVNGENIDDFIEKHIRQMPNVEQRICNIFIPVLDALSYIHKKGILHLDVKPSNIMVENGRNSRLMDLGIVEKTAGGNNLLKEGLMGTPKYAAPEQFAQSQGKLTFATDIYEVGVTLYELITRHNPFIANSIDAANYLHKRVILKKTPLISNAVLSVLQKATAVDPINRYQCALDMKVALQNALKVHREKTFWEKLCNLCN